MNSTVPPTLDGLNIIFGNLISVVLALGGFILFFMIISSGFKYLTSGGDPKAAEGAKKTFTYAVGGLVLLSAAYLILNLIGAITGVGPILNTFDISK
jgi:hypothetical protein